MNQFKLTLSYDGTNYAGWQIQSNAESIQALLERALSTIAGNEVRETAGAKADVVVRCDTESYLLLVYGRRNAAESVEAGRMDVAGDSASMGKFENWFRGL